jgi:Beta/Gamma crystallin
VRLYADPGYGGAYKDVQGDVPDLRALGFNDSATSFGVPAGTNVAVYEHPNYEGICEELTASDPDLRGNPIGDDSISSLRVGQSCPLQAVLYADPNYGGKYIVLDFATPLGGGEYRAPTGTLYRQASSIYLAGGMSVHTCNSNYNVCEDFGASDPDLRDNLVGDDSIAYVTTRTRP